MSEVTEKRNPDVGEPWFTNLESRWLRAAEGRQLELETVRLMLAPHREVLVYERVREFGDRIETVYVARWRSAREGEEPLIDINGRNRPMTESELQKHFERQIEQAIAARKQ
jgi:hypothetical protein